MRFSPPFFYRLLLGGALTIGCLAALALAGFYGYDVLGQREWAAWLQAEKARTDQIHVVDFLPVVPPEQNFGALPIFTKVLQAKAKDRVSPLTFPEGADPGFTDNWTRHRFELRAWRDFLATAGWIEAKSAEPAADLRQALTRYDRELNELAGGIDRPAARFDGVETNGPFLDKAHCWICHHAACLLALRANVSLREHRTDEAFADLKLIIGLRHQLRSEPGMIGILVQINMTGLAMAVVTEGLASGAWSDTQLEAIGRELDTLEFLAGYAYALQTERAQATDIGDYLLNTTDPRARLLKAFPGQMRRNQRRLHRYVEAWQARIDLAAGILKRDRTVADDPADRDPRKDWYYQWFYLAAPLIESVERKVGVETGKVRLLKTACALKRYRLARGGYPETLEVLVPTYLRAIPHEVYSLEPIIYRPLSGGRYELYLRGANQFDDGGRLTAQPLPKSSPPRAPKDRDLLDWPWFAPGRPR